MGWSQTGWAHIYFLTDILRAPEILNVAAICEISFTLHCDKAMTFTQFLPISKKKGLDFTY